MGHTCLHLGLEGSSLFSGEGPGHVWGWEMLSPLWGAVYQPCLGSNDSTGTTKSVKPYTNGSGLLMDTGLIPGSRAINTSCHASAPAAALPHPCLSLFFCSG